MSLLQHFLRRALNEGMPCTSDAEVAGKGPFVAGEVTKEWMEAALGLEKDCIVSVESKGVNLGGSGIPKCLVTVVYGDSAPALCRQFFAKLTVKPVEGQSEADDVRVNACREAHNREACFYRFVFSQADERTLSFFPRCFHASSEVILLEDATRNRSYDAVSSWLLAEPAPNTDVAVARLAVTALAEIHSCLWDVTHRPGPEMLDWEELIAARQVRMTNAGTPTKELQYERLASACDAFGAPETSKAFCQTILELGFEELYRMCLPNLAHASVCHGDSNPGNFLVERNGSGILLVDFQEPIYQGPGISDVARLLVSGMAPASRMQNWEEIVQCYHLTLTSRLSAKGIVGPSLEATRKSYLLALLADALFITAVVPGTCFDNPATILFRDIVERSIQALVDHEEDFLEILGN